MDTDKTTETETGTEHDGGEGTEIETIAVPKKEYDTLNQTLGSYKKQIKDYKKALEKPEEKETPQSTKSDDTALLQKLERMSLRQAGITHQDDVDLARMTAKKWGVDVDEVLADDDFKVKLERQQTARANVAATSGVKGSASNSQSKQTPEFFIARGEPPTAAEVPDRKLRAKIVRAMMAGSGKGKTFYND